MKDFLFLFRGGMKGDPETTPALWQEQMMRWKTWMDGLAAASQLAGGARLNEAGTVIDGSSKKPTDGPFAEGKEVIGGYLLVKAEDHAAAVEMAKDCPIYAYDGSVEIREILAGGQ